VWRGGASDLHDGVKIRTGARGPQFAERRIRNSPTSTNRRTTMLRWAVTFFIIAIIAGVFGFGGIAASAAGIAKILFVVFLVFAVVSLFFGRRASV